MLHDVTLKLGNDFSAVSSHEIRSVLKEQVDQARLKRIFSRPEILLDWQAFADDKLNFTKEVVQKIWAGLADVRLEDLEEQLTRDLEGSRHDRIHKAYRRLLPGKAEKLLTPVEIYDGVASSGKGLRGVMERAWTLLSGWKVGNEYEDLEAFTSRLADREPPVGTVAAYGFGFYAAEKIFASSGAYVTLWKNLSEPNSYLVVCRGTAASNAATTGIMSAINDVTPEIGFLGIKAVWPEVSTYLMEKNVATLEIIGKSLGGGHAQYLATLFMGLTDIKVEAVKTFCSVGVPDSVHEVFHRVIREKGITGPDIRIYRNGGDEAQGGMDYVPYLGGGHLYLAGKTVVYYAVPKGQTLSNKQASLLGLLHSFTKAHNRQTSFAPYDLIACKDVEVQVAHGRQLESLRTKASFVFSIVSAGCFRTENFHDFYQQQKKITLQGN